MKRILLIVLILLSIKSYSQLDFTKNQTTEREKPLNKKELEDLLNLTKVKLNLCLSEKEALQKQNEYLKQNNSDLINNLKELTVLTTRGAQNLEKSLESLKKKDSIISELANQLKNQNKSSKTINYLEKNKISIVDNYIKSKIKKLDVDSRPYEYEEARNFIFHDLDSDGVEELLAFYTLEGFGGGNNWQHYLAIFKVINDKHIFIDERIIYGDVWGFKYQSGELIKKDKNKLVFKVYGSSINNDTGYEEMVIMFINNTLVLK